MSENSQISSKLKEMRKRSALTQEDFARMSDIKYTTLIKIESGAIKNPSVQIMARAARTLGVTIEELL